jgi:hypothetical protein
VEPEYLEDFISLAQLIENPDNKEMQDHCLEIMQSYHKFTDLKALACNDFDCDKENLQKVLAFLEEKVS